MNRDLLNLTVGGGSYSSADKIVHKCLGGGVETCRFFGASVSTKGMVIAAVTFSSGKWCYIPSRTRAFQYIKDDQNALRRLAADVERFATSGLIDEVYLRSPALTGEYAARFETVTLMTLLHLSRNLKVHTVHFASLGSWLRHKAPEVPKPAELALEPAFGQRLTFELYDRALQAAVYGGDRQMRTRR